MSSYILLRNAKEILTLSGAAAKQGRGIVPADLGSIKNASVLIESGKIIWIGEDRHFTKKLLQSHSHVHSHAHSQASNQAHNQAHNQASKQTRNQTRNQTQKTLAKGREKIKKEVKEYSCRGQTLIPGLVECHTHLVFGGNRAEEFEQRNQGVSYQEIAKKGGGILSTMRHTRALSEAKMLREAQSRVERFVEQGVTTLEIKTGYALDLENEIKCLQVINKLKGPEVISTFLGAHARPPEFLTNEDYLEFLVKVCLPQIKRRKLSKRVDIFFEKGFFEGESAKAYLQQAQALGFSVVIHADQLSLSGGSELAVQLGALSADHAIQVSPREIAKLSASDVTAVLLPSADLYMKCSYPPAREMIDGGVRVALSTDFNPGSSPSQDLALVGLLARLQMKMSLAEVITAYTLGAAFALNAQSTRGSLEVGKLADIAFFSCDYQELFYSIGAMRAERGLRNGKWIR